MEPKEEPFRKITIKWVHQPDWFFTAQTFDEFRRLLLTKLSESTAESELPALDQLDSQVTGDDHSEAYDMIMNSYHKHNRC